MNRVICKAGHLLAAALLALALVGCNKPQAQDASGNNPAPNGGGTGQPTPSAPVGPLNQ